MRLGWSFGVWADVLVAFRRLRTSPVFAGVTILVLALGVAIATAFVDIVNGGLLKEPIRVERAVRFVASTWDDDAWGLLLDSEEVAAVLAAPPDSLDWVAGHGPGATVSARVLKTEGTIRLQSVTPNYFSVTGARPLAGRVLRPGDELVTVLPPAVVSERFWRTALGSTSEIVGCHAVVAGRELVIVGIAPESMRLFGTLRSPDILVTSQVMPVRQLFGALHVGASLDRANAEIRARYSFRRAADSDRQPRTLEVRSGLSPTGLPLGLSLAAGSVVAIGFLFVASAVSSFALMLLARLLSRADDMIVRFMLGARTGQIVRAWVIETSTLAIIAAILGSAVASALAAALVTQFSRATGVALPGLNTSPDWRVFAYVFFVATLICASLATVIGAFISSVGVEPGWSRVGSWSTPRQVSRRYLLEIQVGVTTLLLLLAAFLARTSAVKGALPEHLTDSVIVAWLDQAGVEDPSSNARALTLAESLPVVSSAALTTRLFDTQSTRARIPGSHDDVSVQLLGTTPDLFAALDLSLRRGRLFGLSDEMSGAPVALVSEATAERVWRSSNPVGDWLVLEAPGGYHNVEVIGVVANLTYRSNRAMTHLDVYIPYTYASRHWRSRQAGLVLRSHGRGATADHFRTALRERHPEMGLISMRTLAEEFEGDTSGRQFGSEVMALLGTLGLFLALTGLYGLTSYLVSQRRREIGIRLALGAQRFALCRAAIRDTLPRLAVGLVAGTTAALVVGMFLQTRSFPQMSLRDAVVWLAVDAIVLLTTLAATAAPSVLLSSRRLPTLLQDSRR